MRIRAWRNLLAAACSASLAAGCSTEFVTGASGPRPGAAPHTFPAIPNRGGHVLSPLRLVVVAAANDNLRDSLFAFADALLASAWWRTVAGDYGVASAAGVLKVTGAPLSGVNLTSSQLQGYVRSTISASAALAPDGRTLYLLYLPAGASFEGNVACQLASGYHQAFGNTGDAWAVVQRCQSVYRSVLEELTVVGSHEVIEATTDPLGDGWGLLGAAQPWTSTPWAYSGGGSLIENADFCVGTRYREGDFYYQRVYSNAAVAAGGDPCVPGLDVPYYNTRTEKGWYGITGTTTIPVTGWSTGGTGDWVVTAFVTGHGASNGAPALTLSATSSTIVGGAAFPTLNDGRVATLGVTFPPGSPPGSYATILIHSFRFDASGERPPPGEDYAHTWAVGVWVPFGSTASAR